LLDRVELPASSVHRMRGELAPEAGSADYARRLAQAFGRRIVFDLTYLGLGPDGHTASLFPHHAALAVDDRPCAAVHVPDNPAAVWRLTLTYPALNASRRVVFLVAGGDKAEILARVIDGPRDPRALPAQGIAPAEGELVWVVDQSAASLLRR
jgi:6-phosphogluconolactonase